MENGEYFRVLIKEVCCIEVSNAGVEIISY